MSDNELQVCAICGEKYLEEKQMPLVNLLLCVCKRCGSYRINVTLFNPESAPWSQVRHLLSAWVRRENKSGIIPTIGEGLDGKSLN